jgi:hypothetical protein
MKNIFLSKIALAAILSIEIYPLDIMKFTLMQDETPSE